MASSLNMSLAQYLIAEPWSSAVLLGYTAFRKQETADEDALFSREHLMLIVVKLHM